MVNETNAKNHSNSRIALLLLQSERISHISYGLNLRAVSARREKQKQKNRLQNAEPERDSVSLCACMPAELISFFSSILYCSLCSRSVGINPFRIYSAVMCVCALFCRYIFLLWCFNIIAIVSLFLVVFGFLSAWVFAFVVCTQQISRIERCCCCCSRNTRFGFWFNRFNEVADVIVFVRMRNALMPVSLSKM